MKPDVISMEVPWCRQRGYMSKIGKQWAVVPNGCANGTSHETPWLYEHTRLLTMKHNVSAVSLNSSDEDVYRWGQQQFMHLMPSPLVSPQMKCLTTGNRVNDWLLCGLMPPCLVLSVGIGQEWAFDVAAARLGCEVHSFDPTSHLLDSHRKAARQFRASGLRNLHFHPIGVGESTQYSGMYSAPGRRGLSAVLPLEHLIARFAHNRAVDILKLECEGCEWREVERMATHAPAALCSVRQLYVELHVSTTLGMVGSRQRALSWVNTFRQHIYHDHTFAPFRIKLNPGSHQDQDHVPDVLRQRGLSPVACCYIVQLRRVEACSPLISQINSTSSRSHCWSKEAQPIPSLFTGWPDYRLGDVVHRASHAGLGPITLEKYPSSIASRYMSLAHGPDNFGVLTQLASAFLPREIGEDVRSWCTLHVRVGDVIDCTDNDIEDMLYAPLSKTIPSSQDIAPIGCFGNEPLGSKGEEDWMKACTQRAPGQLGCPWYPGGPHSTVWADSVYVRPVSAYLEELQLAGDTCKRQPVRVVAGFWRNLSSFERSFTYLRRVREALCLSGFDSVLRVGRPPDEDFAVLSHSAYYVSSGGSFFSTIVKGTRACSRDASRCHQQAASWQFDNTEGSKQEAPNHEGGGAQKQRQSKSFRRRSSLGRSNAKDVALLSARAAPRSLVFRSDQYDISPCAGVGYVGDLCPSCRVLHSSANHSPCEASPCAGAGYAGDQCPIVLPCSVKVAYGSSTSNRSQCSVRWLRGLGYNPSAVAVQRPQHNRGSAHEQRVLIVAYRFEESNPNVVCANSHVRPAGKHKRHNYTSAELAFVDEQLDVVGRVKITGERCVHGLWRANDPRLFVATNGTGSRVWVSYVNEWGADECEGPSKGHFIAELRISRHQAGRGTGSRKHAPESQPLLTANLYPSKSQGGVDVAGNPRPMQSPRNGGVLVNPLTGRIEYELIDIAPTTMWYSTAGEIVKHPAPPRFSLWMHNSIHPLWIPELGGYLGVGHRHFRSGANNSTGDGLRHAPFRFGYSYRHVFFMLRSSEGAPRISRFSREFCLPALASTGGSSAPCEGIQFIMSAFRLADGSVGLTYGINDCFSGLLTVSIGYIQQLLEFAGSAQ